MVKNAKKLTTIGSVEMKILNFEYKKIKGNSSNYGKFICIYFRKIKCIPAKS